MCPKHSEAKQKRWNLEQRKLYCRGTRKMGAYTHTKKIPNSPKSFSKAFIFYYFFYFTILHWFCHTSTCIHHECTHLLFLTTYFTSFFLCASLNYFSLLTFLIALYVVDLLLLLCILLYQWGVSFHNFPISSCGFIFTEKSPLNISFKAGLAVQNSFSFFISVKLLISPSNLNGILTW